MAHMDTKLVDMNTYMPTYVKSEDRHIGVTCFHEVKHYQVANLHWLQLQTMLVIMHCAQILQPTQLKSCRISILVMFG